MRKAIFYLIPNLLIALLGSFASKAQSDSWNVNLPQAKIFTSINPKDDPGVTVDQMWQVSVRDIMEFSPAPWQQLGILATLNDKENGAAKVSMYLYDETTDNGKGPLIFQCYTDKTNDPDFFGDLPVSYNYGNWLAWWPQAREDRGHFYFNDYWSSNDIKSSTIAAAFYNYNQKFSGWNAANSGGTAFIPYGESDNKLPVIIELEVFKANVQTISLPGIGFINENYFTPPVLDIDYTLTSVTQNEVVGKITVGRLIESRDQIDISDLTIVVAPVGSTNPNSFASTFVIPAIAVKSGYTNDNLSLVGPMPSDAWIIASFSITITDRWGGKHVFDNRIQFLYSFASGLPFVYTVNEQLYDSELSVFTLTGGKSAEYCVEKAIASLYSGISETWDVRLVDGKPDLKGGGPVSVYADPNKYDFLLQSVEKTVNLYNDFFGKTTPFNTVVIGPGMAQTPYLCNAMKAPFLPLQFLVSVHSVTEVKKMLDAATASGLSAFSMMGYDSTMPDVGVAWIKLKRMPQAYVQFLSDHKVQNVIIMGMTQDVAGRETVGRRIWLGDETTDADYSEGSMYMMKDRAFPENIYKETYKDYYNLNIGQNKYYLDWERGMSNSQVDNLRNTLLLSKIGNYLIQSPDATSLYRWGLDIQLAAMNANAKSPAKLSMNEYLIGFPEYELYTSTIPWLYSQNFSDPADVAFWTFRLGQFKTLIFPDKFKNLPVYIQAKADRSALLNDLKTYFTNVTMDSWQQADVWDPSDGMNSPCELVAQAIASTPSGISDFKNWNNNRNLFGFDDFQTMIRNSKPWIPSNDPALFPRATTTTQVKSIPEAGLLIQKNTWDPNSYWQPPVIPDNISITSATNSQLNGFLDGQYPFNDRRKQSVVIARFSLQAGLSDEYDLRVGYKFNVTDKDGLTSYDPQLGQEQKMDCFEFTSVPLNHWLDIPSRMMARSGAVWITNGSSYDFDNNGLPGVAPFIKKDALIKAQPQMLSYKGEGVLAWDWGTKSLVRNVKILSRSPNISGTGLPATMKNLFQNATENFPNVLGGATYMAGQNLYNINDLQPDWMKNYARFPSYYLGKGTNRCFFAPLAEGCEGTEVIAPANEGWNNCGTLSQDAGVQRISALAYQQYPVLFENEPNARTFAGVRADPSGVTTELNIGVVSGDYGIPGPDAQRITTKKMGMFNYELSQFSIYRQYSQLVNLDGGSASSMWLNGRGPLHEINGYPLATLNQGPYYSRLQSSFIMLVPKLHTELLRQKPQVCNPGAAPVLNNTAINWKYSDATDLEKDKAFIDLSPNKDSLSRPDGQYGVIAGNFSMSDGLNQNKNGGILFYAGEDMYYPDANGEVVRPRLRNLMVIGVGLVLTGLRDTLLKTPALPGVDRTRLDNLLQSTKVSTYYIKVANGIITEFIFEENGKSKYLTGDHDFLIFSIGDRANCDKGQPGISFWIDAIPISSEPNSYTFQSCLSTAFLNIPQCTHAYIGAVNLDGRFLTGDIAMAPYNYFFVSGREGFSYYPANFNDKIFEALLNNTLPDVGNIYFKTGIYALQCMETQGQHAFALAPKGNNRFYGLRVNNFIFSKKVSRKRKPLKARANKPI